MSDSPEYQDGPSDEAGIIASCRRLHAAIDTLDQRAARALGVSRNDLRCLHLLENGPVSPSAIGRSLSLTSGSVTVLLDRLEKKDLVRRLPSPDDRRALLIEATAKAWQSLAGIYRPFGEALSNLSSTYGQRRANEAAAILGDIADICVENVPKEK
ncbi:MAG: MarR family transcriptional regulator [Pseudomonadota bacterium]